MSRALQLAAFGGGRVSPNPFVGAVITARGQIIGEGYHRHYGGPHAEVNAIASVAEDQRHLLREATMYVSLEPCSHYGKTPPCADLIVNTGIPKVVIASEDPFLDSQRNGIKVLKDAGIEVEVGLMRNEARFQNRRFITAHTSCRPFILLKWAQSADGYIGSGTSERVRLSNPLSEVVMHRERSLYDAIMVGTNTALLDKPRLECRLWPSRDPKARPAAVTFGSERINEFKKGIKRTVISANPGESLEDFMARLYSRHGITSLMVEGGYETLQSFINRNLFDELRIEVAPVTLGKGVKAPEWQLAAEEMHLRELPTEAIRGNYIRRFVKKY